MKTIDFPILRQQYWTFLYCFPFGYCSSNLMVLTCLHTVDENTIATIKMRNNFCYPLKMVIFPILLSLFQLCDSKSCRSQPLCFIFCISFVDSFKVSFLYSSPYSYRYFTILNAIAKSKEKFITIAIVGRAITIHRKGNKGKKQRDDTKPILPSKY